MTNNLQVKSVQEALEIGRSFASQNDLDASKTEAIAKAWFDAAKEYDESSPSELRAYLARRFQID